jgi:hypothetical protein
MKNIIHTLQDVVSLSGLQDLFYSLLESFDICCFEDDNACMCMPCCCDCGC